VFNKVMNSVLEGARLELFLVVDHTPSNLDRSCSASNEACRRLLVCLLNTTKTGLVWGFSTASTLSTAATLEWRRRSHGKGVRRSSAAYCCDLYGYIQR
jgi:hypothetical protein